MELSPEERQHIYQEEKVRLEAQSQIKKQAQAEQNQKIKSGCGIGCATVIGLFLLLWIIGSLSKNSETSVAQSDSIGAYVYAEAFVKDRLRSPATAKFCGFPAAAVTVLGNDTYQVTGWVDAQNGFGALLRNDFVCKLHKVGTTWHLNDVSLVPR